MKKEVGVAIGALPTMAFGDRCSGEGGKRMAVESGRVQLHSQGRKEGGSRIGQKAASE